MDPLPGAPDEVEVQVDEQVRERGRVRGGERVEDEGAVGGGDVEQRRERLHPRLVDLAPAGLLVAVAEVEPHVADQLLAVARRGRVLEVLE